MPASFYWITKDAVGRLGIAPRPRGGDWLQDELQALRNAGVDTLVSLLTPDEQRELHLQAEAEICQTCGMEYLAFPINDRFQRTKPQALPSRRMCRIASGCSEMSLCIVAWA